MCALRHLITKKYVLKKSLAMLDIKIIILLHIFFSQYFKISSSKLTTFLIRCYCICATILSIYLSVLYITYLTQIDIKGVVVNTMTTVEFLVAWFISQITGNAYLTAYTGIIQSCDSLMGYPKKIFGIKPVFVIIVISLFFGASSLCIDLFKSIFWAEMFLLNRYNVWFLFSSQYMMMSIDMTSFKVLLAVGFLQNRLMLLRKTLENTIPGFEAYQGFEENDIRSKLQVVRKFSQSYHILLDAFETVYGHLELTMFSLLLFDVPRLIMFGYSFLKQVIYHKYTSRIIIVDAVRYLIRLIAPCVVCELCYIEVERLKMLLTTQIIQSSDNALRAELQRALDFVNRRPFSFALLRALRVDIRLPVTICALALTYIILLIEFTHFVL